MNHKVVGRIVTVPLVALALSIGGCMTTKVDHGADVKALQNFKIVKGITTLKDLTDQFGQPESIVSRGDGTRMLSWSGVRGTANSNMTGLFIPFAPTTIKYNAQSASLQVTVNQSDIVTDYTSTTGDMRMLNTDPK
jgi:hypothetical protein